jgi:hypothetical protein
LCHVHGSLDDVLELAHVARIVVLPVDRRAGADLAHRDASDLLAKPREEVRGTGILDPLPERRGGDHSNARRS